MRDPSPTNSPGAGPACVHSPRAGRVAFSRLRDATLTHKYREIINRRIVIGPRGTAGEQSPRRGTRGAQAAALLFVVLECRGTRPWDANERAYDCMRCQRVWQRLDIPAQRGIHARALRVSDRSIDRSNDEESFRSISRWIELAPPARGCTRRP